MLNSIFKKVIGVSQFCVDKYNAVEDVSTKVLKNGIDLNRFKMQLKDEEKNKLLKEMKIESDDFVVLFCGRLIEVKGILQLIKAMKEINNFKIKLLIIGSPNFSEQSQSLFLDDLKKEAECLGDRIIFSGYISNEELYKYHQISDIQVIPSIWEEAAGLVAIEAMASGLPIIATRSGGMIEYVDDECAKIIEKNENIIENLKNAILELYNDPETRKKMSEKSRLKAQKFSIEKFYNDFVEIIENFEK